MLSACIWVMSSSVVATSFGVIGGKFFGASASSPLQNSLLSFSFFQSGHPSVQMRHTFNSAGDKVAARILTSRLESLWSVHILSGLWTDQIFKAKRSLII